MPSSNSVRLSLCSRLGLCHTHLRAHATRLVGLQVYGLQEENWDQSALSIVVVGASGDLAKKKIFPALFALYYEKMLPKVCSSAWRTCHSPPAWLLDAMPCPPPPCCRSAHGTELQDLRVCAQQDGRRGVSGPHCQQPDLQAH